MKTRVIKKEKENGLNKVTSLLSSVSETTTRGSWPTKVIWPTNSDVPNFDCSTDIDDDSDVEEEEEREADREEKKKKNRKKTKRKMSINS